MFLLEFDFAHFKYILMNVASHIPVVMQVHDLRLFV